MNGTKKEIKKYLAYFDAAEHLSLGILPMLLGCGALYMAYFHSKLYIPDTTAVLTYLLIAAVIFAIGIIIVVYAFRSFGKTFGTFWKELESLGRTEAVIRDFENGEKFLNDKVRVGKDYIFIRYKTLYPTVAFTEFYIEELTTRYVSWKPSDVTRHLLGNIDGQKVYFGEIDKIIEWERFKTCIKAYSPDTILRKDILYTMKTVNDRAEYSRYS